MSIKEITERLWKAIETDVTQWEKTRLSRLEQYLHYQPVIEGVLRAALFILPTDEYLKFSHEVQKKYYRDHPKFKQPQTDDDQMTFDDLLGGEN